MGSISRTFFTPISIVSVNPQRIEYSWFGKVGFFSNHRHPTANQFGSFHSPTQPSRHRRDWDIWRIPHDALQRLKPFTIACYRTLCRTNPPHHQRWDIGELLFPKLSAMRRAAVAEQFTDDNRNMLRVPTLPFRADIP